MGDKVINSQMLENDLNQYKITPEQATSQILTATRNIFDDLDELDRTTNSILNNNTEVKPVNQIEFLVLMSFMTGKDINKYLRAMETERYTLTKADKNLIDKLLNSKEISEEELTINDFEVSSILSDEDNVVKNLIEDIDISVPDKIKVTFKDLGTFTYEISSNNNEDILNVTNIAESIQPIDSSEPEGNIVEFDLTEEDSIDDNSGDTITLQEDEDTTEVDTMEEINIQEDISEDINIQEDISEDINIQEIKDNTTEDTNIQEDTIEDINIQEIKDNTTEDTNIQEDISEDINIQEIKEDTIEEINIQEIKEDTIENINIQEGISEDINIQEIKDNTTEDTNIQEVENNTTEEGISEDINIQEIKEDTIEGIDSMENLEIKNIPLDRNKIINEVKDYLGAIENNNVELNRREDNNIKTYKTYNFEGGES